MNKSILTAAIAILFLLHAATTFAQQNSGASISDTLTHLREKYILQKDKYIHQPLSLLLADLDIKVASYAMTSSFKKRSVCDAAYLSFLDKDKTERQYLAMTTTHKSPAILCIIWETPIPRDQVAAILAKSTKKGEWQAAEREFYGRQIVKDIRINDK